MRQAVQCVAAAWLKPHLCVQVWRDLDADLIPFQGRRAQLVERRALLEDASRDAVPFWAEQVLQGRARVARAELQHDTGIGARAGRAAARLGRAAPGVLCAQAHHTRVGGSADRLANQLNKRLQSKAAECPSGEVVEWPAQARLT